MKKISIVFLVLLLVCAGMVMMNCPSDPIPPIENPDFVLEGGKYQVDFDTPKIENGKEYQVIFFIEECDDIFRGSYLGGKICYKMNLDDDSPGAEKVLSGWLRPIPHKVSDIKTYIWTFKAGDQNEDDVAVETTATTPAGGQQYFSFTAQNSSWDNYKPTDNFNIKGKFEVHPVITWESAGTITLGNTDNVAGKGELSADEMAKIRNMPAGSIMRLTVDLIVDNDKAKPGNCLGLIGKGYEGKIAINLPKKMNGVEVPPGHLTFTVDIGISSILEEVLTNNLTLHPYKMNGGTTFTKAELFQPKTN